MHYPSAYIAFLIKPDYQLLEDQSLSITSEKAKGSVRAKESDCDEENLFL